MISLEFIKVEGKIITTKFIRRIYKDHFFKYSAVCQRWLNELTVIVRVKCFFFHRFFLRSVSIYVSNLFSLKVIPT